jgi:hypothetical protein
MVNWRQLLLELRSNYKPIASIAREVGMNVSTLQKVARVGAKDMLYSNGSKIIELHDRYVKCGKK